MTDFEQVVDRKNTRSIKWDAMEERFGLDDATDILPMWIADMDFKAPEVVIRAIQETLDHGVFGYSYVCEACKDAVRNWMSRKHQWETKNEWMLTHHGVVPAIASVIETFSKKGEHILITPPVYPPFYEVPEDMARNMIICPMNEYAGEYSIDFQEFEEALKQDIKLFILCNPHNPGGKVWKVEELVKMIELCKKYDVLILSDEIHADLVFAGSTHTPLASIAGEEQHRIITCVAPTKTFNLAGVQASFIIASCPIIRERLALTASAHGQMNLSPFAAAALKAAYEEGEPWLNELLAVVSKNMDYAIHELTTRLPSIRVKKPEATYLLWIDYRETGLSESEVMKRLLHKGKIALEPGSRYGKGGEGFLRMNVACPFITVQDGVERLIKSFS